MNAQQRKSAPGKRRPKIYQRLAVPAEMARLVLFEAGHRCAVCGTECPLERAHIIPWRSVKEHTADNLICLCPNCHTRADSEQWGYNTLRQYKLRPWVLRHRESHEDCGSSEQKVRVRLTINLDLDEFNERNQRLLQYAVASFLEVSPGEVTIKKVEKGSVKVTLEVPRRAIGRISNRSRQISLFQHLYPLELAQVEVIDSEESRLLLLWQEVLGDREIKLADNFFELGGSSLLLVKLHNRVQQEFGAFISVVDLFRCPTIETQARFIRQVGEDIEGKAVNPEKAEAARAKRVNRTSDLAQRRSSRKGGRQSA